MRGYNSAITISLCETVSRLAGYDALKRLKASFGGTKVYVPAADTLNDRHPLVRVLGIDAAAKVCAELHRTAHYVPQPSNGCIETIVMWTAWAGLKRAEMAGLAGCSEAYVYRIMARMREAGLLPKVKRP